MDATSSHLLSLRSILISFSHQRLDLTSVLFPSRLSTETVYAFLIFYMRAASPIYLMGALYLHQNVVCTSAMSSICNGFVDMLGRTAFRVIRRKAGAIGISLFLTSSDEAECHGPDRTSLPPRLHNLIRLACFGSRPNDSALSSLQETADHVTIMECS